MAATISRLRPAAVFQRGDLVTYQHLPMVVVFVKGGYADLAPGDDLALVTALGRVLTNVSKLARRERVREHYVTIEPICPAEDGDTPRLCVAEHRTGEPTWLHGVEGWITLGELRERARDVAARVGAEYREPTDELAVELLGAGA
ncbi:hypothetical protein [Nonomuraea sp. NPDC049709]|uniref:hypothetical protein n=1 Tax=Nonomuraea sp. NPDC049709 TaxID=3154736 RepID=UPI00341636C7